MKKILIVIFLLFIYASDVKADESIVTKPDWKTVAPVKYRDVNYIEPINRPKWVKPISWIGYVGTLMLVPFPFIIDGKDAQIENNNNWAQFKENFEKDIAKCEQLYKQEDEIYKCYENVQLKHIQFLNMQVESTKKPTVIYQPAPAPITQNNYSFPTLKY